MNYNTTELLVNGRHKIRGLYRKWASMHRRCKDIKCPAYPYYGQRGITVCERWSGSDGYHNFAVDMGEPPVGADGKKLTLNRINTNGPYSPDNCHWATWKQQMNNRRPRKAGSPNSLSLYGRARLAGFTSHNDICIIYTRIKQLRWTEERALSTPITPKPGNPGKFNEMLTRWKERREQWKAANPGKTIAPDFE